MSHKEKAAAMVKYLSDYLGLDGPGLEDDAFRAEMEGRFFACFWSEEFQSLFLEIHLGVLDSFQGGQHALESLLEANYLWQGSAGGSFGLFEDNGRVYWHRRMDFPLSEEPVDDSLLVQMLPPVLGAVENALVYCRPNPQT
jgi:hypothetical protein